MSTAVKNISHDAARNVGFKRLFKYITGNNEGGRLVIKSGILGPVVQSIVSLTSSLRGQLVTSFTTLLPNTLKFFVEKMKKAFAVQNLLSFFSTKNIGIFEILVFEILTNR